MVGVQEVFRLIIVCFGILGKVAYFAVVTSSACGQFIVKYTIVCITFMCSILGTIFDVLKVLYEDYCIFVLDVFHKVLYVARVLTAVVEWLIKTVYSWWEFTKSTCLEIYELMLVTVDGACLGLTKVTHCIASIPEVLKNFMTLVGSGIWLALQLIPLGFVYIISMCVFLIGRSCEEIISIVESTFRGCLGLIYGIIRFLRDIPFEAQAGLILGSCILWVIIKYHTYIMHYFASLCVQMKYALLTTWTSMEMLLLSIFTNQNEEPEHAESSESEESSEESENLNHHTHEASLSSALSLCFRPVPRVELGKTNDTRQHLVHQLEQEQESKLCVVCQDRNKCVIVLPCRHLCLCTECSVIIKRDHGTCPMCRQAVRRTMKIYV
jgi:RING-finger-containing E3 ubiquitin ligase